MLELAHRKDQSAHAITGDRAMTQEFRRCLGNFATGITIVTTTSSGRPVGVTANSFSSISLDPPVISWAIGFSSRSFEAFNGANSFAINILADNQVPLSQTFSSSSSDKFEGVDWQFGLSGAPILNDVVAHLECAVHSKKEVGDHLVMFGEVKDFSYRQRSPLLFLNGRYAVAEDHPIIASSGATELQEGDANERLLFTLISRAHHSIVAALEEIRSEAVITLTQNEILAALSNKTGLTMNELNSSMYFGRMEIASSARELICRGDIACDAGGVLSLTGQGSMRRKKILNHIKALEMHQLEGMRNEDKAATRRLLNSVIESNQNARLST